MTMSMLLLLMLVVINTATAGGRSREIGIGVILDMETSVGKVSKVCIEMALDDFYKKHPKHTTKIILHVVDSKNDRVEAASAAIQLIKNFTVAAIIGPQRSSQADFVVAIGNKARVPILSLATTPSLSPKHNHYFIRISHPSSSQAQPISAFISSFPWREVVLVYQDGEFGTGFIPSLSEALLDINVQIKHPIVISPLASDDDISHHLDNIKTNQTRVFVVHLLPHLASRFFNKAQQARMMKDEYAWIVTDVVINLLHTSDVDMNSMQGVVGVKPNIPESNQLKSFRERFKRNKATKEAINVYGLWSYDATYALAMTLEGVGDIHFQQKQQQPLTDLDAIGVSNLGPTLLSKMNNTKHKGLSGDIHLVDGQLQSASGYLIVNIVGQEDKPIDLWTRNKSHKISNIEAIIWPSGSNHTPRGWDIVGNKLSVGYPEIGGFRQFIEKAEPKPKGFCVEVFETVMKKVHLPNLYYDYKPYPIKNSATSGTYKDLVDQIYLKEYDVVVGDVTIRADRSNFVDFTLPYTDSGVSMIVPIKKDDRKSAWVFMRPLEKQLWFTTCAFFIYTGVVVWVLEHRVNKEFRGRPYKQVGMIFWFSFSTLVFAHKEKMISNLSRFVVIVWVFVVLVLQSSYIASLTSILTVQQLQPDFTDIHDLIRQGDKVGYKEGSFVEQMLKDMGFNQKNLIGYNSLEDYNNALSNKSVAAIFDELPYLNLFLADHCNYVMVGPTYKTAGFGFAFPKGSPLLPLVSKALLEVTENDLDSIKKRWLGPKQNCSEKDKGSRSGRLSLDSFLGLFYIAGASSTSALLIYIFIFLYENKNMLLSDDSLREKLSAIATTFHQEKQVELTQASTDNDDDSLVVEDNITNTPPTPENHLAPDDDDDEAEAEATPANDVVEETRN